MAITSVGVAYKTPDEVKDYSIDYSKVLLTGEFIESSTWRTTSSFLKLNAQFPSISQNGLRTIVWLSEGATNQGAASLCEVINEVVTSQQRTFEYAFYCKVQPYNQL